MPSYKQSANYSKKLGKSLAANFPSREKRKKIIPKTSNIADNVRLPLMKAILGRFLSLYNDGEKSKKSRILIIRKELLELWRKFNFPVLSERSVDEKVTNLVAKYEKARKRMTPEFEELLEQVFDITKVGATWLSSEDKLFYKKQMATKSKVGYTTLKDAPKSSIHPSKRIKKGPELECDNLPSTSYSVETDSNSTNVDTDKDTTPNTSDTDEELAAKKKKYSTASGTKLVLRGLSTSQASMVCKSLSEEGHSVPTPSQSGIWKSIIKRGKAMKGTITSLLRKEDQFCLHFDGKRLDGTEYVVVCLQSVDRLIKLGILKCESGSSADVYKEIELLLTDFDCWKVIKMVICDTTAVNTGRINGIVIKLQKEFQKRNLPIPQYIGCQHHVLDLILKHIMESLLQGKTTKPTLEYDFIGEIQKNYLKLQEMYKSSLCCEAATSSENPGWRDDLRFLFELSEAFKYHQVS